MISEKTEGHPHTADCLNTRVILFSRFKKINLESTPGLCPVLSGTSIIKLALTNILKGEGRKTKKNRVGGRKERGTDERSRDRKEGRKEGHRKKLRAVQASAARGGLRHTHGSWFINVAFPLLVYQRND